VININNQGYKGIFVFVEQVDEMGYLKLNLPKEDISL